MKRLLASWIVLSLMLAEVTGQDTVKLYAPVVPNRIADKYVTADYRDIGGYLGYRLEVNLPINDCCRSIRRRYSRDLSDVRVRRPGLGSMWVNSFFRLPKHMRTVTIRSCGG